MARGAWYGGQPQFKGVDGAPRPVKRRPCLCCERPFDSEGPGNRLCMGCRVKASEVSPYAL